MVSCTAVWSLACRGAVTCSHRVSRPLTTTNTLPAWNRGQVLTQKVGADVTSVPLLFLLVPVPGLLVGGRWEQKKTLEERVVCSPTKAGKETIVSSSLSRSAPPPAKEAKLSSGIGRAGFGKVGMLSPWALGGKDPRPGVLQREEI